jgi:hypothetical protein
MRKFLVVTLVGALLCAALPGSALAGDRHAGNNLAAGLILGATAAVVGGVLVNAFAPPVVYAPPPIVYAPAPPVVYVAPPVVYQPVPVVIHRHAAPGHWYHARYERGREWHRH